MEWIARPDVPGAWLRDRLRADWSMHHFVPQGFDAYARVFHPAAVRSLPDRAVPAIEEWMRMPDAEQRRLIALFIDESISWADTAAAFGTTMHALAQWQHLVRTPPEADWNTRLAPDGREFSSPDEGSMPVELLARIAAHLTAATVTPDDGFAAVWEGWGGLLGFHGHGPSRTILTFSDEPKHEAMLARSIRDPFNTVFRRKSWQEGILSREISEGPRLRLPDRDHVLFSAAPAAFADPGWILDAPWRDRQGEANGFDPQAQHPSLIWPADRAWVLASEIDFDSTIIGGSHELIRALCADDAIEALPLRAGSHLHWDGDEINR